MDFQTQGDRNRGRRYSIAGLIVACCLPVSFGNAADFHTRFEKNTPTWSVSHSRTVRLLRQRRVGKPGGRYEHVRLKVERRDATVLFEHRLPSVDLRNGVRLSLRWNCNHAGAVIALRVAFPGFTDPKTRRTLTTLIPGDRDRTTGKWRTMSVELTPGQLRDHIRNMSGRFRRAARTEKTTAMASAVVQSVVVAIIPPTGTLDAGFAELRYGPRPAKVSRKTNSTIIRAGYQKDVKHPVTFRLDRLLVDGYPFFPRMVAWHREKPSELRAAGYNLVWIPRYNDTELIRSLRRAGLWITANPPAESSVAGKKAQHQFGADTRPILFWNVGTRIPASARKRLIDWTGKIQQADERYGRPILGDVAGDERVLSRHISLMGLSRHVLHTGFSFKRYRNFLVQKRRLARPGTFVWTWIQTEPRANANGKLTDDNPLSVEPEQIRLQVYAALAAGCRGIGYWKTTSLDSKRPGAEERRLMIAQLNLELDLLSPWLTSGTVAQHSGFVVQNRDSDRISRRRIEGAGRNSSTRRSLQNARTDLIERIKKQPGELEATMIRSPHGTLLLPVWYGEDAQFTPGKMVANNARIVVHGISESASAYEITTTGVRSLTRKRVTGGVEVTIPRFDQTSAIILTADRRTIAQLKERAGKMAPASARLFVRLSAAKLKRVRAVNEQLAKLGVRQPDAPQLLHQAGLHVAAASSALEAKSYQSARREAENGMQLLRILQRAHWNDAVRSLPAPVATPYAVCFQSLPAHYRLLASYGNSKANERGNLLPTGDFEDFDKMTVEGWKHTQNSHPALRAVAELYPKGKRGQYSLRLVAAPIPGKEVPVYLSRPVVTVRTPSINVRKGQIVRISGWANVTTAITGHPNGAMLYDSIGGQTRAMRWNAKTGWRRFTLLREAKESGPMRVTLVLHGMGEVRFDDLRIDLYRPKEKAASENSPQRTEPRRGGLRFFERIPSIPAIPRPRLPNWAR